MLQGDPRTRLRLCIPRILFDYLPHRLPSASCRQIPTTGRLYGQHIGYPSALQTSSELAVLPVEDVPDHRPERDLHLHGSLDQLQSYAGLGAKGGIHLAAVEVVGRSVGFDLQWIVESFVGV